MSKRQVTLLMKDAEDKERTPNRNDMPHEEALGIWRSAHVRIEHGCQQEWPIVAYCIITFYTLKLFVVDCVKLGSWAVPVECVNHYHCIH